MSATHIPPFSSHFESLCDRVPNVTGADLVSKLRPPKHFDHATFENYRPDPNFPSQADASQKVAQFFGVPSQPGGFFSRTPKKDKIVKPGIYLDGGFGVGKTHLLAALYHSAPQPKRFGTFIEFTALAGALGFAKTVTELTGTALLCIDEFELDDPGDTMIMTRLLGELIKTGTRIAATSNTPPNSLGEGRFAAQDFLREINAIAANFETVRIDGLDYRRRDNDGHAAMLEQKQLNESVEALAKTKKSVSLDDFRHLLDHLQKVHQSAYFRLIEGIDAIAISDVVQLHDQSEALRFVAFVDRVYDAEIPILASGIPCENVFDEEMLSGGYRKKYLRAISRLIALTTGELPPE